MSSQPQFTDLIAREKIDGIRERIQSMEQKLNEYTKAFSEKMKGDIQLASKIEHVEKLVTELEFILIRGNDNTKPVKSLVERITYCMEEAKLKHSEDVIDIREHITGLKKKNDELVADLEKQVSAIRQDNVQLRVAELEAKSRNLKLFLLMISTIVTSVVAFVAALIK